MLFALFGLGVSGCSEVNEVAIDDISFESLFVLVMPNSGKDSVSLSVWLNFDRPEDDACYELSPDTRGTIGDLVLTASALGGIRKTDWKYPDVCIDGVSFDHPDVPLSTTPSDTTIRIEDESGHIEVTIRDLFVKRQVSFIDPADGVVRPNTWVRMLWTPETDPVHGFGVSFLSSSVTVNLDNIDTHDFREGTVEFFTETFFRNPDTNTYFEPGTMLNGLVEFDVFLEPTVISCGIKGECKTSFRVMPSIPADLLQE
jgi:hypothetical protein